MRFSVKSRPGFTLIELLISIAIIGILTGIMMVGINQQKNISLARRTAEQLQNDIQAMQNNALSGQIVTGTTVGGFGVFINQGSSTYKLFADALGICSNAASQTCTLNTECPSGGSCQPSGYTRLLYDTSAPADPVSQTTALSTPMYISSLVGTRMSNGTTSNYLRADLVYSRPSANLTIFGDAADALSSLTVKLKNIKLNICYAVTITAASGTVTNRQFTTASC